ALGLASAGPAGLDTLRGALGHESGDVARAAVTALGLVRRVPVTKILLDPDRPGLHRSIYRALGDLLDGSALPLRYRLTRDLDPWAAGEALLIHPR
ncbi:MAG: hypothetical protein ACYTFG_19140, partial [Planctomycetota bacterium]